MTSETPLRYGKHTSQRWRARLEVLERGACCICQRRPPVTDRVSFFDRKWAAIFTGGVPLPEETLSMLWIDHDHETDEVRGLLCSDCNAAIMPLEHRGPAMDDVTRRYLAEGDRQRRAVMHLTHVVVRIADHELRLVSRDDAD